MPRNDAASAQPEPDETVEPGSTVRIQLRGGETVEGTVEHVTDTALKLRMQPERFVYKWLTIPADEIESIEIRKAKYSFWQISGFVVVLGAAAALVAGLFLITEAASDPIPGW